MKVNKHAIQFLGIKELTTGPGLPGCPALPTGPGGPCVQKQDVILVIVYIESQLTVFPGPPSTPGAPCAPG